MKEKNLTDAAINNKAEEKNAVTFFSKSGSPKNFKETIQLVLNLVINLLG